MSIECTFFLNKPQEIYGSGEEVEGHIILYLPNAELIEDIHIVLRGRGSVIWEDKANNRTRDSDGNLVENCEFRSDESYADVRQTLMGDGHLRAGEHPFPFILRVPDNCPASFEGSMGSIRYNLSVLFVTKTRRREKFTYDLSIEKRVDFDQHPEYQLAVQVEEMKKFCWMSCTEGRILFTLTTPFGAYAPLQQLHFTLRVENQTMSDVRGYEVAIIQKTTYTAKEPEIKERYEIDEVFSQEYEDECLKLTTRIFKNYILIPPVASSTGDDDQSSIIHIEYKLRIIAYIAGCALNSLITLPIKIGTIALEELVQVETIANDNDSSPLILSTTSTDSDRPPAYQNIQPPRFSDAIRNNQPPSFDTAIRTSVSPCETIGNGRTRPFIGYQTPN